MLVQRLGPGATAAQALRRLAAHADAHGEAGPAALTGSWFGAAAVIAPQLRAVPVAPADAFTQGRPPEPGPPASPTRAAARPAIGGGWIGYLAYPGPPAPAGADRADGAGGADGADGAAGESPLLPAAAGGWTDHILVLDDADRWWWESLTGRPCPPHVRDAVRAGGPDAPAPRRWRIDWTAPSRAAHRHGVEQCLAAIAAGEIYQACVCTAFTGTLGGAPVEFFADAVAATRPARGAFVQGAWGAVASLSPETFLVRRGAGVASSPIKGTAPLTSPPARLRASVKDVAENVMIVDLVRNDLGRVAATGSVRASQLLEVHPAPGVWHLVSTVTAELRPGATDADLLAAAFPPASVTGTPKRRARELLAAWEPGPRGVYCGAVGMVSPAAGLELGVAIRTVQFAPGGRAVLGVGGGITADSDPDAEWQECLDKAASIVRL